MSLYPEQFSTNMDMPEFLGTHQTYLIASTPRSGSHFLGHCLMETGEFGVPLEYLNRAHLYGWRRRFGKELAFDDILRMIMYHRTSPSSWFGIKIHWAQYEKTNKNPLISPYEPISRYVHIYRRDLLKQAISYLKAKQTGAWISGTSEKSNPVYNARKIAKLAERLRDENRAWQNYFTQTESHFSVAYEDLVQNPAETIRAVGRYIDPAIEITFKMPTRVQKQADEISTEWYARFLREESDAYPWIMEPQAF